MYVLYRLSPNMCLTLESMSPAQATLEAFMISIVAGQTLWLCLAGFFFPLPFLFCSLWASLLNRACPTELGVVFQISFPLRCQAPHNNVFGNDSKYVHGDSDR